MVFVLRPCRRGISRAQFVAFANGSVYPVPPLFVVVDPLPEKSSNVDQSCSVGGVALGELTLIGYSSDKTGGGNGEQSRIRLPQIYLQFGSIGLIEKLGALIN